MTGHALQIYSFFQTSIAVLERLLPSSRALPALLLGLLVVWGAFTPRVFAASGGPDAFGTVWLDSNELGGPALNYLYAPGSALGLGDDDSATVPIGFDFAFYGITYSEVTVHSNGGITFGSASALSWTNGCPLGSAAMAAPFWDDLDPSNASSGGVFAGVVGSAPNRIFVAEWWSVSNYAETGDVTLEVQLHEADGRVEFHYLDVDLGSSDYNAGVSASVGLSGGGTSLSPSCNANYLDDFLALAFYPPGAQACTDMDEDGSCAEDDCDDADAQSFPGGVEACDATDNDCDGTIDEGFDQDTDGWTDCEGDCDDSWSHVFPGAPELCDGLDNNCDGAAPNEADADEDGVRICEGDCDDTWDEVYPGATELAGDGVDQDCDGADLPLSCGGGSDGEEEGEGNPEGEDANDEEGTNGDDDETTCDEGGNGSGSDEGSGDDQDGDPGDGTSDSSEGGAGGETDGTGGGDNGLGDGFPDAQGSDLESFPTVGEFGCSCSQQGSAVSSGSALTFGLLLVGLFGRRRKASLGG